MKGMLPRRYSNKKNTFMFQVPENQVVAKNVAAAIDALLTYRNTITAQWISD